MDTKKLISDAKARFAHNSAKVYLKEKYESKLIIAEQGGLWKADADTITILTALSNQFETKTVLIDTFDNPVTESICRKIDHILPQDDGGGPVQYKFY